MRNSEECGTRWCPKKTAKTLTGQPSVDRRKPLSTPNHAPATLHAGYAFSGKGKIQPPDTC